MNKSLGVSFYISDFDSNYVDQLKNIDIKYAFTSLHINEEEFDNKILEEIFQTAKKNNMHLIIDVSPNTLKKLNITDILELKNLDIDTIRLDFGFDDLNYVKELTNNFQVVLNASVIDETYLKDLADLDVDFSKITVLHNFYPKKYTGLEHKLFIDRNEIFRKYNIETLAFIAGDCNNRLPTYESLPTLEKHRGIPVVNAGLDLFYNYNVDGVLIGDGRCNTNNLKRLQQLMLGDTLKLRVIDVDEKYIDNKYLIRPDYNKNVIRLNTRTKTPIKQDNSIKPNRGSIMITNEFYGRYNGEIEITNIDLEYDYRYNILGYIHPEDLALLDYIDEFTNIIFINACK